MVARLCFRANVSDRYVALREVFTRWAEGEGPRVEGQTVLIKPNCVSAERNFASTHGDAVRATLEVLRTLRPARLILGEASSENTLRAFRKFGYLRWADRFGAEVLDLNSDAFEIREIFDVHGESIPVRVSRTALQAFRVSLAKPKTHDCVIVTLGIKNLVVGSIPNPDKAKIHQGYGAIHLNLALLARELAPHLSVIDGLEGMEGEGPVGGDPVPHRFVLVGSDPVAVDAAATTLMGFDPREIGYLVYCARSGLGTLEEKEWQVVGDPLSFAVRRYRPHPAYAEQRRWELAGTALAGKI